LTLECFGPAKTTLVSDGGQQYIAFCSANIIVWISSVILPFCATKGVLALLSHPVYIARVKSFIYCINDINFLGLHPGDWME